MLFGHLKIRPVVFPRKAAGVNNSSLAVVTRSIASAKTPGRAARARAGYLTVINDSHNTKTVTN